ncbi:hypothetical protein Cgig2_016701 [Carnegiea gigantea]|uniref:DUF4408 domain-containing protein n=1 Tax=Carnegiea gigantea TaxID=171969 RepID=A0A9Q1KY94_9CARY|nr:hypothetical protein Cgig2_016701 [Carnegiea gigantea]
MVEVAAIVAGWLTPTSLFVLLNIVIATIFFTSAFGIGTATHHGGHTTTNKSAGDDHYQHSESGGNPQLLRASSLFSRVASFNCSTHHYSNYHHHHSDDQAGHDPGPPALARSPSFLSRLASFNFCRAQAQPDPAHNVSVVAQEAAAHDDDVSKEGSETDKAGDESRGETMVMTEKKEENEREGEAKKKKKAVVRRKKATTVPFRVADDEVDAKADDFINKFKQQLKLQRLESLLRYRSCSSLDDDTSLDEFAIEPVGVLGAEPVGEYAGDLVGKFVAALTGEPRGQYVGLLVLFLGQYVGLLVPFFGSICGAARALLLPQSFCSDTKKLLE